MLPTNRQPTHPGEMLLKEFLEPMHMTQKEFCTHLGWTYARLNEIIHGRRGITVDSALTLGEALQMDPDFWLNLQKNFDLWVAKKRHVSIKPLSYRLIGALCATERAHSHQVRICDKD